MCCRAVNEVVVLEMPTTASAVLTSLSLSIQVRIGKQYFFVQSIKCLVQ